MGPARRTACAFRCPTGSGRRRAWSISTRSCRATSASARPAHGFLEHWARQGVLLLNSVLTVEMGLAASHRDRGWERFTDAVIRLVNAKPEPVVFMLWGSYAQKKASFVDPSRHLVLKAPHPSPLSAHSGFLGCRHFSKANDFLESRGLAPIDWALPECVRQRVRGAPCP